MLAAADAKHDQSTLALPGALPQLGLSCPDAAHFLTACLQDKQVVTLVQMDMLFIFWP
jgi:hypothetical protein